MGLFDSVKAKAGELAADAERAGKVAAAQARIVTLQNEVRKAERDLGQAVYALIEQGEAVHPDLLVAAGAVDEALEALHAKEREIAGLRGEGAAAPSAGSTTITYTAAGPPSPEPPVPAAAAHGPEAEPAAPADQPPTPVAADAAGTDAPAGHTPAAEAR
jgi:hypothetical protein